MTIVVTGATGNIGRPLVQHLVDAGAKVRAVTRHPGAAALPAGAEAVSDAAEALEGATAVFLNSRALGPQLVDTIGSVLGRPLAYRELPAEAVRQRFLGIGLPAEFADAYIAMLAATVDTAALVTHDVEKTLDRPATPFATWVRDNSALFTAGGQR